MTETDRNLFVSLSRDLCKTLAGLPGIHGVCVTAAADEPLPGVIACSSKEAKEGVDRTIVMELISGLCQQINGLAVGTIRKDRHVVDEPGQNREDVGRTESPQPLIDRGVDKVDPEVQRKVQPTEGEPGKSN